jgi:hypothetical protein
MDKTVEKYRKIESALLSLNKQKRDKERESTEKYDTVLMLVTGTAYVSFGSGRKERGKRG